MEARACFGQIGYHPMEALMLLFDSMYAKLEDIPERRTIGEEVFTCEAWALLNQHINTSLLRIEQTGL